MEGDLYRTRASKRMDSSLGGKCELAVHKEASHVDRSFRGELSEDLKKKSGGEEKLGKSRERQGGKRYFTRHEKKGS